MQRRTMRMGQGVFALAMVLATSTGLAAKPVPGSDVKGKKNQCLNIDTEGPAFDGTSVTWNLEVGPNIPSCTDGVYSVYVVAADSTGNFTNLVASQSRAGDGINSVLAFNVSVPGAEPYVCAYATSARKKGEKGDDDDRRHHRRPKLKLIDRAPDADPSTPNPHDFCIVLVAGGSPGGRYK